MKLPDLEKLSPLERREFLKQLTATLTLPVFAGSLKFTLLDMLLGSKAYAQMAQPMNFLEVNFRDQWDFGSVFVAPSIARNYENIRSQTSIFEMPTAERNNFYLSPRAAELRPHLDNIAVIETCECVLPGNVSVHGHEAGNPIRSPGRTRDSGNGRIDMATVDRRPGGREAGNEILYSSSPTPAVLHNYYSKTQNPNLRNGTLLRSSIRPDVHTYYHFEANLANAQLTRYFSKSTFLNAFQNLGTQPTNTTVLRRHGNVITSMLKKLDQRFLQRSLASSNKITSHNSSVDELGRLLTVQQEPISVELTAAELTAWQSNIGPQLNCAGDEASNCTPQQGAWGAGEIFAHAFKLFRSGLVRTVAIDFDMTDVHSNRTPLLMNTQAEQSGRTLARLITNLKASGLWENTIIAMYTLDGSRSPLSNSTGENTKNAVVLAGGKIRGGYYGDVSLSQNGTVTYFRPNDSGVPVSQGATGRDLRVPAADIYKTVASLSGVPMNVIDSFPDARSGRVLSYLIR